MKIQPWHRKGNNNDADGAGVAPVGMPRSTNLSKAKIWASAVINVVAESYKYNFKPWMAGFFKTKVY